MSLRAKLTLWMVAIALTIEALLGLGVLLQQRGSIGRMSEARIQARADYIAVTLKRMGFAVTDEELGRIADESVRYALLETSVVTLYSGSGDAIASNVRPAPSPEEVQLAKVKPPGVTVALFPPALKQLAAEKSAPRASSRVVLQRVTADDGREFVLLLATTDTYFEAMLGVTLRVLLIMIPIGAIASGVAGWLVAGLAIAPLRHLRLVARSFAPSAIDQALRPPRPGSREVAMLEGDMEDARSKIRRAFFAQDRFMASVSHELNTPIAVLLAEAQTLGSKDLTPDGNAFARSVADEMKRLGRIIERFLMLGRLRGGLPLAEIKPCDMGDLVMESIAECAAMAEDRGIPVSPLLNPADPPLLVLGDMELLRVLATNLLRNAIRFGPTGKHVTVRAEALDGHIEFAVRDHGPGVPERMVGRLTDRFDEATTQSASRGGHGLGLSIALNIAELHGGEIRIANVSDGGCEIVARLPRAR